MQLRAFRPESPEQIVPLLEVAREQRFPWWGPRTWVSPDLGPNLDGLTGLSSSAYFEQAQTIKGDARRVRSSSVHKVLSIRDINRNDRFHLVVIDGRDGTERKNDYAYIRATEEKEPLRHIISRVLFSFVQHEAYKDYENEHEALALLNTVWEENDRRLRMADQLLQSMLEERRST